jgi:hypothetical protein
MRTKIVIWGAVLFLVGIILGFLAGATFGNFRIPLIYGSNQIFWLFVAFIGIVTGIVGLFLKSKK